MTAMLIGYIIGIVLMPKYLSQVNALKISGILGVILVISIVLLSEYYYSVAFNSRFTFHNHSGCSFWFG